MALVDEWLLFQHFGGRLVDCSWGWRETIWQHDVSVFLSTDEWPLLSPRSPDLFCLSLKNRFDGGGFG